MFPAPFRVVLDANVLIPSTLRDTLLRAAEAGVYQLYWSDTILEEMARNLVSKLGITGEQAAKLLTAMNQAFPEARVTGHEPFIDSMRNDPKDRHVAAAAVKAGAHVIVTCNLKDFRELPDEVEAQSPDEFLCHIFDLDPSSAIVRLEKQAAGMKKRVTTLAQLLDALAKIAPKFADAVREHLRSDIPTP